MGYTRIIQYGDTTEIFEYEKDIHPTRQHKRPNKNAIRRAREIRNYRIQKGVYVRSKFSISRAKKSFFRLCHHNNCHAKSIHFLTITFAYDVSYKEATRHISRFMGRIQKTASEISYISVPELTKKNRFHFYLLLYNLPPTLARDERKTRNLQRQFQRGYIDIVPATYNSEGIAGYMAKYMAKALGSKYTQSSRAYNASRNIKKISSAGGNSLSGYTHLVVPDDPTIQTRSYDVPYLGTCKVTKYTKKQNYESNSRRPR